MTFKGAKGRMVRLYTIPAFLSKPFRSPFVTECIAFRRSLVEDIVGKVRELNKENFAVRQHLRYVEQYDNPDNYQTLTYEDTLTMGQELAPLIVPDHDDAKALRFDALMYGMV